MSEIPSPDLRCDTIRIGIVSISDRASNGVYEDKGLPALRDWLSRALHNPITFEPRLNPAEKDRISATLIVKHGDGSKVKQVIARATSDLHMKMLQRVGADRVVFPSKMQGARLGQELVGRDPRKVQNLILSLTTEFLQGLDYPFLLSPQRRLQEGVSAFVLDRTMARRWKASLRGWPF